MAIARAHRRPTRRSSWPTSRPATSTQDGRGDLGLLERLNREFGKTILMVTHDPRAAKSASVVRHLDKGVLLPLGPQS